MYDIAIGVLMIGFSSFMIFAVKGMIDIEHRNKLKFLLYQRQVVALEKIAKRLIEHN